MQTRWVFLIVLLTGTLLFYLSCEEKGVERVTASELIEKGWQKFEAGNSAGAGSDFSAALSISTTATDSGGAFLGLGWAQLRLIQAGLAEKSLVDHLQLSPLSDDGRAGLAFAYLAQVAQDKFQSAIDAADEVLSSDSSWSFGHDSSIDYSDLHLLLAQSYYGLADYSESLRIVQVYFDRNFDPDIDTPEGRTELAVKIESLWTG
jgi:tetratricopeptide (TPR) repeat protein